MTATSSAPAKRRNKSGQIGTAAETAVVNVLRVSGFPYAERRRLKGSFDQGDITGTPGVAWEVKGGKAAKTASDAQVEAWLRDTETERINAGADIGVLILARAGIGPANAGQWWAVLRVAQVAELVTAETGWIVASKAMTAPIRMTLADACVLINAAGYGREIAA